MDNIEMLINEIESDIMKAKKVMFSNTDVVINRNEFLNKISRIRMNYPLALKDAADVINSRDQILDQAQKEANQIVQTTKIRMENLVTQDEVVAAAHDLALKIEEDAHANAEQIRNAAVDNALHSLGRLEDLCNSILSEINGIKSNT